MSNLQVLLVTLMATVLLGNGNSINAFRFLHPHFPVEHAGGIFNGDTDTLTRDTILRAEKWSNFHGSNVNIERIHPFMRGIEWCQPLKRGAKRMVGCQERGRFPVKNECRGFLMCLRQGDTPIPSCCPYGLYFDHIKRTCVEKKDAHCFNVCHENGARYADPNDPQKYLECSNLGIPESVSCPKVKLDNGEFGDSLVFDTNTKQCKTQETIDAELDNLLGKDFDNAFQRTFGVPSFQVFNEDDYTQNVSSVSSTTTKPTTNSPSPKSSSSTPIPFPFVGFGPQPGVSYHQLIDMSGDDSDSDSFEITDKDKTTYNPIQSITP